MKCENSVSLGKMFAVCNSYSHMPLQKKNEYTLYHQTRWLSKFTTFFSLIIAKDVLAGQTLTNGTHTHTHTWEKKSVWNLNNEHLFWFSMHSVFCSVHINIINGFIFQYGSASLLLWFAFLFSFCFFFFIFALQAHGHSMIRNTSSKCLQCFNQPQTTLGPTSIHGKLINQ